MIAEDRIEAIIELVDNGKVKNYIAGREVKDMAQELLALRDRYEKLDYSFNEEMKYQDEVKKKLRQQNKELIEWADYWYEHRTKITHWAGAMEYAEAETEYSEWMARVKGE